MKLPRNSVQEVIARHKCGEPVGIFSVCSANPIVIETSIKFAAEKEIPILIEATCNQVNQFGGYTGMLPKDFADFVWNFVRKYNLPKEKITLGGDHLGPYPWRDEPVQVAMKKSSQMIHDYVNSGYKKIHLDASMKCADDDPDQPLDIRISADRAAELCATAEKAAEQSGMTNEIIYVIGTEVPLPGGVESEEDEVLVTLVGDVQSTIASTKEAFFSMGLEQAWERVIAVVVQPGVDFGDDVIFNYKRERAKPLSKFIEDYEQLVFEAHSTDYQTPKALKQLVEDHFVILKVGPELTFAYREAIFALELLEIELLSDRTDIQLSNLGKVIDAVMLENPVYWQDYYQGTTREQAFARKFSFSDRIRYYWPKPEVKVALQRLYNNLENLEIPAPLLSQYFPRQYQKVLRNELPAEPTLLVKGKIQEILKKYAGACGFKKDISLS
jgi:D-tagatose-1,6-bisphosphate aldolase subunit GatZ/KbaZ